MGDIKVYFSDYFDIEEDIIENYGAANISLITCSLWTMMKELAGMTQPFVRTDQLR